MKLDRLIKNLTAIKKQYGNLDVIAAADDEGNSYMPVHFEPTVGIFNDEIAEFQALGETPKPEWRTANAVCVN